MSSTKKGTGTGKTRNWAFICYPESMPENWQSVIYGWNLPTMVSPLHNADINADDSEKKPHYHVILMFDGPVTADRAQYFSDQINGTHVQRVASLRSYARYLCHLDNPEKASYQIDGVQCYGSVDYLDLISSAADIDQSITQMEEWCDTNGVYSYAQLCRYARREKPEWARLLRHRCTVHMKAYLQSCQWEIQTGYCAYTIDSTEDDADSNLLVL